MCNESDQELSDLEIGSRTWSKLEKNMRLLGFREGAGKGRDQSLQQGFDLGYLDGVKLGEYLGIVRGVLSCQKELGVLPEEELSDFNSSQICITCAEEKNQNSQANEITSSKKFEEIISAQRCHSNKIISNLEETNFSSYFNKQ